jgi:hypothetical protein
MPDEAYRRLLDIHRRWIGYVQPTGLVVSPVVLVQHGLGADANVGAEQVRLAEYIAPDTKRVSDIAFFLQAILGWQPNDVMPAPEDLAVPLPELGTTLRPSYVVREPIPAEGASPWQMLIGVEPEGRDLDAMEEGGRAWAATPQARFERLLRATEIPVGLLTNGAEIRLVYAPRGEASGHATFRIADMLETAGRPILSAFLMLLHEQRLFGHPDDRLPRLLEESRRYQTEVSAALASQVLEGLYELLRGLHAADLRVGATRLSNLVCRKPDHVYAGLLTVMMRLVFVLYAEDRGLFPDASVWAQNYSLAGLYTRLRDDAALHPDTMDDRYGAWAQLVALFRIVHRGAAHGPQLRLVARRGRLFDPDRFPFLEGRDAAGDPLAPPRVSDGTIWRILQRLMLLDGERLSYRTLDVEQIGSVYETMMGFTVQLTRGASLAVRTAKRGGAPTVIDLDALLTVLAAKRAEHLAKQADRKFGNAVNAALRAASNVVDLERALQSVQDRAATPRLLPTGTPVLQPSPARRRTGSHYTPRSLTEPIVRTALKPVLASLGEDPTPDAILELKVVDPAMGSGAFLVEACRQLADALVASWSRRSITPEIPQDEDPVVHARRLVAQRCLYGVDRNPMAVDIALLSLWLTTLAREHEFTFLSHALRAGDSLVGLNVPAIAALNWSVDGEVPLAAAVVRSRIERAARERARIRDAFDWMGEADLRPLLDRADVELEHVRHIGDAVLGAFFSGANERARREKRGALADAYVATSQGWWNKMEEFAAIPRGLDPPLLPFHWQVEFPEVFDRDNPGFDVVIGNPPFGDKNAIAENTPDFYQDWLKTLHSETRGNADLVAHFFRRAFTFLRKGGCFGLIATNTIRQGNTRESGLQPILKGDGTIIAARRRLTWPGAAVVVVCVVHVLKSTPLSQPLLDGKPVRRISAFLVEGEQDAAPAPLRVNAGITFQGSILLGMGFTFDDQTNEPAANRLAEMQRLILKDPRNAERILPYLGGEEVNDSPTHAYHRHVIDFADFPLRRDDLGFAWEDADYDHRTECLREGIVPLDYPEPVAADWPDLLALVEDRVKPERETQNDEGGRRLWWRFLRPRPELHKAICGLDRVLATCRHAPHLGFVFLPTGSVFAESLVVAAIDTPSWFALLQSRIHEVWARFLASSMKDDLRYTPSSCFETFPLPGDESIMASLENVGRQYYEARVALMQKTNHGLTTLYNRFNDPEEHDPAIVHLRELHAAMDRAVLDAYHWTDLHPVAIHEREWEGEEGDKPAPWRLRWPQADRDEVLARLLELNRRQHEGESQDIAPIRPARRRRRRNAPIELIALVN